MNRYLKPGRLLSGGLLMLASIATAQAGKADKQPAQAPVTFAPVPAGHELASLWNDPEFTRRLLGSYGFASEVEPRMTPEEQATYRDKVVPLLREDQQKARETLESLAQPGASAVFDFTLGNIYFQAEDLTNAVTHFQAAIAKFPDYRRAHKNLGFALVRSGQYAAAIKPLVSTVELDGGDGKVFGLLGFAYASLGRHVSAEAAYRQALVFEPENLDFKLGLVKSAVSTANYDYALALLDELIREYPERENLWSLQANLYIQKEQPAKAIISLEMLRRAGKATPPSLYLLGDLHMSQDAPDLALAAYLDALNLDNGQNPTRALRAAQILVSRNAFDQASQLFVKIRQAPTALSDPDELKLLKLESKVAMSSGAGEKAIETLEQIVQKDPLDGEALLLAGDYYARNGQKEKAELRYQTASAIQGFEADAYVKHAQLLVQSQKYAPAAELLRKAQKVKPRDNVQRYLDKVDQLAKTGRS
ncbi:MAG: tetratricopeptide repeat protein [Verrucomicrobia bacterium]|jgi:Flp pilus assembly protein TadD|nr:tetratricopeptide repeat protein [Verrucomicrobiota bacterium]